MARKTKIVVIPATGGRDAGKRFVLTEFAAVRAEKWATRALLAATAAGIDIPPEVVKMGAPAVLAVGFRALLTMAFADAEPLLDEMLECVELQPDAKTPNVLRPIDADDIEEVTTLLTLRSEVVELHTGFSIAAFLSTLGTAASTQGQPSDGPNIPTSPAPSESSSAPDLQISTSARPSMG